MSKLLEDIEIHQALIRRAIRGGSKTTNVERVFRNLDLFFKSLLEQVKTLEENQKGKAGRKPFYPSDTE